VQRGSCRVKRQLWIRIVRQKICFYVIWNTQPAYNISLWTIFSSSN
jgi:hypothetical protein